MKKIGYEYAIAKNGREAIDLLESGDISPDAILLDIRMPVMPGLAALPQIRSILPSVPVIMLTAFGDLETGLAAMKSGAFDYLVKPSSIDKIQETLGKSAFVPRYYGNEGRRRAKNASSIGSSSNIAWNRVTRSWAMCTASSNR